MTRSERFTLWKPLNDARSIRLLKVSPAKSGHSSHPLTYTLSVTTIVAAAGKYHALSYAWEDPGQEETIIVNGQQMKVRRNLFAFLGQLEAMRWEGDLFIDAISINQSNLDEKNKQVQIMARIFGNAKRVFVWLGPGSEPINRFFDNAIGSKSFKNSKFCGGLLDWELDAVLEIVRKRYFSRLWVVQELGVAKQFLLMCGDRSATFKDLKRLIGRNEDDHDFLFDRKLHAELLSKRSESGWLLSDAERWQFIAQLFWRFKDADMNPNTDLSNLICSFGHLDCYNPQDRVYALLGLWKRSNVIDVHMNVDYHRSMAELFNIVLASCQNNSDTVGSSSMLDMVILLKLNRLCPHKDQQAIVTACEEYLGKIGAGEEQGSQPSERSDVAELSDGNTAFDQWIRNPGLRLYGDDSKAIIDSTNILPGDEMYSVPTGMASLSKRLPDVDLNELVIVVREVESRTEFVSVGILFDDDNPFKANEDDDEFDKAERKRLPRWRTLFEEFFQTARLEIVKEESESYGDSSDEEDSTDNDDSSDGDVDTGDDTDDSEASEDNEASEDSEGPEDHEAPEDNDMSEHHGAPEHHEAPDDSKASINDDSVDDHAPINNEAPFDQEASVDNEASADSETSDSSLSSGSSDASFESKTLSISATLEQWIAFSEVLVKEAASWESAGLSFSAGI